MALNSGLVRQTIRETLAFDTLDGKFCTFPIGHAKSSTVVKAEIEFCEIAVQVFKRGRPCGVKYIIRSISCQTTSMNMHKS